MVAGGGRWWWVVLGGAGARPLEATEASSRAQFFARRPKSNPLPTPPGPLKLRVFKE